MHMMKVNAALMRRLALRSHTVAGLAGPDVPTIQTISDADGRTHLVFSSSACTAILSDDTFVPPDIASAVETVGKTFGKDVSAASAFLRRTPLLSSGAIHKARRGQFLRHQSQMRRRHAAFIEASAERHCENIETSADVESARNPAAAFVDCILRQIFDTEMANGGALFDRLTGLPASVLDYVQHPRLLGETSSRIAEFLSAWDRVHHRESEADGAALPFVLLGYVLMGRDPLIGGLSAFLHDFALTQRTPAERDRWLGELSARRLFQITSPVNFIARSAAAERDVDGVTVRAGDRLLLMLPYANAAQCDSIGMAGMAFGHGQHTCVGTALSLQIADAFLAAFRKRFARIHAFSIRPAKIVPGVFLCYR